MPLIDSSLIAFSNSSGEVIKELQKVYRRSLSKIRQRIGRELYQIFELDPLATEIRNELDEEQPKVISEWKTKHLVP